MSLTLPSQNTDWRAIESEGIADPGAKLSTPAALAKRMNRMTIKGQAKLVYAIEFWKERGWRAVLARAVPALTAGSVRELIVGLMFNDSDKDVREAISRALRMIPEGKPQPEPWALTLPGLLT